MEPAHLTKATLAIFNDHLGRHLDTQIEIEHLHHALQLRARYTNTDPPRDVIGYIINFTIKEKILRRARNRGRILYHSTEIKLYQDLSQITLQKRKDLCPLSDVLREREIPYRWKFPFCLSAGTPGRTAELRYP